MQTYKKKPLKKHASFGQSGLEQEAKFKLIANFPIPIK